MANWFVTTKKADFNEIGKKYGISPILARIIRNRDVEGEEQIRKYLYGTREDFYNPFALKDMEKAVKLIEGAIKKQLKIRIIGDYDADGICSTFILLKGLKCLGADVDFAIPHRILDGYGLNEHLITQAKEDGIEMIITCDNGIAAHTQIELAHELGMQMIVTDHHEVPYEEKDGKRIYLMPKADAVIDPKREDDQYPFSGICGAVVAYKLIQALSIQEEALSELIQIAAFATVCDVMELRDENRILVKEGLKEIHHTNNLGLKALIEVNQIELTSVEVYHIGFILGPCMNATGRLESADMALRLLMTNKWSDAVRLATELKNLNEARKEMTEQSVQNAMDILYTELPDENASLTDKVLVVYLPDCHESLAGIVAGRIREKFWKPTIVLTKAEEGVKGSGRSIDNYNMFEELSKCKDLFTKFGGHKMAAGVSLLEENVRELRNRLNTNCTLTEEDFIEKIKIDVPMPISYATEKFIEELKLLEPFGVGNGKPVFAQKDVAVHGMSIIGKNRNVVKFRIADDLGEVLDMIYFGDVERLLEFFEKNPSKKEKMTITYYPSINEFRGKRSRQMILQDYC